VLASALNLLHVMGVYCLSFVISGARTLLSSGANVNARTPGNGTGVGGIHACRVPRDIVRIRVPCSSAHGVHGQFYGDGVGASPAWSRRQCKASEHVVLLLHDAQYSLRFRGVSMKYY
jgi:hypothetical protein